ncbi:MAG: hypothetical protein QOE05_2108, partial [Actinomycetota bacterium]|nr:hypothetical protein [Actinomycetota bacterium]
ILRPNAVSDDDAEETDIDALLDSFSDDGDDVIQLSDRRDRRALQRGWFEARFGKHPPYDVEVFGFTRVTGRGERDLLVVGGVPTGLEQTGGLERLVRAAREDRAVYVAEREHGRAVRAEDDDGPGVGAFDVARADDLGEDRQGQLVACSPRMVSTSASPSR